MIREPTHFDGLQRLLHLEREEERRRLATLRASLPLGELEARGLVLLDVECVEERGGLGGRQLITLQRADRRPLGARFSTGDLVTVAPRKAEVDTPPQATVTRGSRQDVELAFDRPPPEWVREGRLRVDLASNEVSYSRARATLARLAGDSPRTNSERERRAVLLGALAPRFEPVAPLHLSRPLNSEQLAAVTLSLSARDFALVHGPPGTGKSTVLAEVASQAVRAGKRVLATAASNAAVDHLLELCLEAGLRAVRVGHPARVATHLQAHTLDVLVETHEHRILARSLFEEALDLLGYARRQRGQGRRRERFANARQASAEAHRLMDEARTLERLALAAVRAGADVTCATLAMLDAPTLEGSTFDVALLDEATQAIEPLALMAFARASVVVLAGDPQQLGPTVLSLEAQRGGLGVSLFERLLSDHGAGVKQLLREQYRMHAQLMSFPSQEFYAGELRAHPSVASRTLSEVLLEGTTPVPPLLFLDTAGRGFDERVVSGSESLRNEGEAGLVVARALELLTAGLPPRELAVITPYRAQAEHIRELLGEGCPAGDADAVEVDTVDAFQGREKDAVLVSLVRSNSTQSIGFLEDLRRMNVALTRARRHLFVVGDSATLGSHPFYASLIDHAVAVGGYRSVWENAGPSP